MDEAPFEESRHWYDVSFKDRHGGSTYTYAQLKSYLSSANHDLFTRTLNDSSLILGAYNNKMAKIKYIDSNYIYLHFIFHKQIRIA